MFIYSLKGSTLKLVTIISVIALALILLFVFLPKGEGAVPVPKSEYAGISNDEERIKLLKSFGYEVEPEVFEVTEVVLPKKFNETYKKYNELQSPLGIDLQDYAGKNVTRYTYIVNNFDYNGTVYANLLIYDNTFIGGDFSSAKLNGFMTTLGKTPELPNAE